MRLEAEGVGVCCSCDLLSIIVWVSFICVWSRLRVHDCVSSSVSAHICVSCTLLCTSLYWPPIDPVPINKSLFDLCLTICVLPNSEQTNRAHGLFLTVNPKSLRNTLTPWIKSSRTCVITLLYIILCARSQRHSILVKKKARTVSALAN